MVVYIIALWNSLNTTTFFLFSPGLLHPTSITSLILANNDGDVEKIIPYRFRPWDRLNYTVTVSEKTKEEEAIAHNAYMQARIEDINFIAIYSDASKVPDGEGIGIGLAAYNTGQEVHSEKTNIGESQLVYNGELEGITKAFEYAATTARKDQEIHIYADN